MEYTYWVFTKTGAIKLAKISRPVTEKDDNTPLNDQLTNISKELTGPSIPEPREHQPPPAPKKKTTYRRGIRGNSQKMAL